jgi:glycine/D-amino acid oxidase-like deaminating enzyme
MPIDRVFRPPSFWLDEVRETIEPRAPLARDESVDVAIVGAGFTGLWAAYYLATQNPELGIAIVESEIAGFGASGRNGGWCQSHHTGVWPWMRGAKRQGAIALQRAMFDTVDEVGRVAAAEQIRCDYAKSGQLTVSTTETGCERIRALLAELHRSGFSDADYRFLDATECDARVRMAGARGGLYSPHSAAVQPAKLARGLAEAVERRGVAIYEQSPARSLAPGVVTTDRGTLRARVVLRCTEGYTRSLPGMERELLPLHSLMIVTEPLPDAIWNSIGAADRVLFGDARRLLTYAQRTADGRIALGAGVRYFYGSGICDYFSAGPEFATTQQALWDYFPMLRDVAITPHWGGALGAPRDAKPFVRFDARSGMGSAGGYTGSGVAAANLAGRTLADLVAGRDTERVTYPWVEHRSPKWEREPLRWIGANGAIQMGAAADRGESRGRPARWRAALFDRVSGH